MTTNDHELDFKHPSCIYSIKNTLLLSKWSKIPYVKCWWRLRCVPEIFVLDCKQHLVYITLKAYPILLDLGTLLYIFNWKHTSPIFSRLQNHHEPLIPCWEWLRCAPKIIKLGFKHHLVYISLKTYPLFSVFFEIVKEPLRLSMMITIECV